jgi:hypothetical protein
MASFAIDMEDDEAGEIAKALNELAARARMRELAVRGHLHEARLGVEGALEAAVALGAEIDNPALDELVRSAVPA